MPFKTKEAQRIANQKWRVNHIDKARQISRDYNAGHKIERFALDIWKSYKMHMSDYVAMLERQHYVCGRCKQPFNFKQKRNPVCIDHNHDTGHVRGMLCIGCNTKVHNDIEIKMTENYLMERDPNWMEVLT